MLTKVFDADDSTTLELRSVELERMELVVAIDHCEIGVRSSDADTKLDHVDVCRKGGVVWCLCGCSWALIAQVYGVVLLLVVGWW